MAVIAVLILCILRDTKLSMQSLWQLEQALLMFSDHDIIVHATCLEHSVHMLHSMHTAYNL